MQNVSPVTQKGQITIPVDMRRKYAIAQYSKVRLVAEKDHIKVYPTEDILDLAGFITPQKNKTVLKAREAMEKTYKRV